MNEFPITSISVYKHGVGFFSRRAKFKEDNVRLKFRKDIMDDILKSLTVLEHGDGKVIGVDFDTSETIEDKLKNTSIHLEEGASLAKLLSALRGKKVKLHLSARQFSGILVGSDFTGEKEEWSTTRISIIEENSKKVSILTIGEIKKLEILDDSSFSDLRYFLEASNSQETLCNITIRLTGKNHDLEVFYIAPAPLWTVNYRFLMRSDKGILQGWSIFHNSLEEDLKDVRLSFITGMPISFVYELYDSFTPVRPRVREEERNAPAPIEFKAPPKKSARKESFDAPAPEGSLMQEDIDALLSFGDFDRSVSAESIAAALGDSVSVETTTSDRAELFEYKVSTPVSVARGKSAMVPILAGNPEYKKEYIYNKDKYKGHPSAVLKIKNGTGLVLERGPITILDESGYAGEGILEFTPVDAEAIVAYAIDLTTRITENVKTENKSYSLNLANNYLRTGIYRELTTEYSIENRENKSKTVYIEHNKSNGYNLFDTETPEENNPGNFRFKLELGPSSSCKFYVKERLITYDSKFLSELYINQIEEFFDKNLIDEKGKEILTKVAEKFNLVFKKQETVKSSENERQGLLARQGEIRKNIDTFQKAGEESYRQKFIDELVKNQDRITFLDSEIAGLQQEIVEIKKEIGGIVL